MRLDVGDVLELGRERTEITKVLKHTTDPDAPDAYEGKTLRRWWWSRKWRDVNLPVLILPDMLEKGFAEGWRVVKGGSHGARR